MKATIVFEMASDGGFNAYMEEDIQQACLSGYGNSVKECKEDLLEFYKELREEDETFPELEFEWKYDIASFLNYYSVINATQLAKSMGINASLLRRYKTGVKATQKTYEKFASAIHSIGQELVCAKF